MNTTIVEQHPPQQDTYADRNLALLHRLMRLQVADPERFDLIPEGATVVILPQDDPDFTQHNLQLALGPLLEGREVVILPEESLDGPDLWVVLSRTESRPGKIRAVTTFPDSRLRGERAGDFTRLLLDFLHEAGQERLAG
jgi:Family of unknown function (DUF5647)